MEAHRRLFSQKTDGDSDYEVIAKITYAGWRITYAR